MMMMIGGEDGQKDERQDDLGGKGEQPSSAWTAGRDGKAHVTYCIVNVFHCVNWPKQHFAIEPNMGYHMNAKHRGLSQN